MKAILKKVSLPDDCSFVLNNFNGPYFSAPWHFHPEYELILVLKSHGKRFVGDNIGDFYPGDLILVGPGLPHWYRNEPQYYEGLQDIYAESLVIQFNSDFVGKDFLNKPESADINQLLNKAAFGLAVNHKTRQRVADMMLRMQNMESMERLIQLLALLNLLSRSNEISLLSNTVSAEINHKDSARINKIYEYIMSEYTQEITITKAADLVNMTESAFSRYFKQRTGKTFTTFINEIRIGHACKLLIDDRLAVTDICYHVGYNNISYFNRVFKRRKQQTPQAYRKAHQSNGFKFKTLF